MSHLYTLPSPIYQSDYESTSSDGNSSSDEDFREMPEPMVLTTAQRRTRVNMFGVTNTEYTQIAITDPVLYIALYAIGDAPCEVDEYHWVFIVGPSHEEADSKGTLYNMEPRQAPGYRRPYGGEWCWLYNQPTVPLRRCDLLARLMIAEVADMSLLQAIILRWGGRVSMRQHVEWMSVRWVKKVLESLDEDEGCLGRRMESFENVEAEGRSLAETEEEKRKGFCLLDARVSTRTLFERERATALLSTATVDVAIKHPVLYVAVCKNDRPPRENDEHHWAFLIGPSKETSGSEGVRCGVELHLDSNGLATWDYNQTIVPICGEDDLLARIMIAEIVDLGPLGEILRDQDATLTTERSKSMAGDSGWNSLAWIREKLEVLERRSECFAHKCPKDGMSVYESMGRRLAEALKEHRRKGVRLLSNESKTLCVVSGSGKPGNDVAKDLVNHKLGCGERNTTSRAIQIVTGVLGAAALEMRHRIAESEQRELKDEQKKEASAKPEGNESATLLAERTKLQHVNEAKETTETVGEKEVTAKPGRSRVTTIDTPVPTKPEKETGLMIVAKDADEDAKARVTNITNIKFAELNKPGDASEGGKVAKGDEEDEGETESDDENDECDENNSNEDDNDENNGDEEDSDADDSDENNSDEKNSDERDEDSSEDSEDDSDEGGDSAKGIAKENTGENKTNARPGGIRTTASHVANLNKPQSAPEGLLVADVDTEDEEEDEDDEDGSEQDGSEQDGSDEDGSDEDGSEQDGSDEDGSDEDGNDEDGDEEEDGNDEDEDEEDDEGGDESE